jgi:hypothetical protein
LRAAPRTDPYSRDYLIRLLPWGKRPILSVPRPAHSTQGPGTVSGPRAAGQSSPWSSAFPPVPPLPGEAGEAIGGRRRVTVPALSVAAGAHCRQWARPVPPCPPTSPLPALFGTFPGTTPMSDFPAASMSGLWPRAFPDRPHGHRPLGNHWDLPVLGHRVSAHARVFDSVGPDRHSRLTRRPAWPSRSGNPVGTPRVVISELNSWPMRTPIDASPAMLPPPAHDTGPWWLATPSMSGSRIPYSMPVYPGAFCQALYSGQSDSASPFRTEELERGSGGYPALGPSDFPCERRLPSSITAVSDIPLALHI